MIKNLLRIYFNEYLHLSENNTNLKKKLFYHYVHIVYM